MSANRSVQAAQRRQTKTPDPPSINRGPQPSISSSQMFAAGANQRMGPGSGQVSGRLAGQQAALSQKQMMEQAKEQQQQQQSNAIGGINKMTIPQAITLITLRLGKVETQLLSGSSFNSDGNSDCDDDHILVDKNVIQSLISRIDALERKSTTTGLTPGLNANSNQDIALLKQQFETIKPMVIQSKNTSATLKQHLDQVKTDLNETKELVVALQNLTMDNSTKISAFNSVFNSELDQDLLDDQDDQDLNRDLLDQELDQDMLDQDILDQTLNVARNNLKEFVEQELNLNAEQ
jgi:hypothetical protein